MDRVFLESKERALSSLEDSAGRQRHTAADRSGRRRAISRLGPRRVPHGCYRDWEDAGSRTSLRLRSQSGMARADAAAAAHAQLPADSVSRQLMVTRRGTPGWAGWLGDPGNRHLFAA